MCAVWYREDYDIMLNKVLLYINSECFLLLLVFFVYLFVVVVVFGKLCAKAKGVHFVNYGTCLNIVLLLSETVDVIQIRLSVYSGNKDKVFNIYRYNPYFQPILRALKKRALKGSNPVSGYNGFEVTLYKRGSYGYYLFIILIFKAALRIKSAARYRYISRQFFLWDTGKHFQNLIKNAVSDPVLYCLIR